MEIHENTIIKCFTTQIERIEKKIDEQAQENRNLKNEVLELQKSVEFQSSKFDEIKTYEENRKEGLKLEREERDDKMAMLEDRSRRDNLRFGGIQEEAGEKWERSEELVKEFIREELGIHEPVEFHRAHRTGRKPESGNRTIVAKFKDFHDREKVLKAYIEAKLWEKNLYVAEDYSGRTVSKRKELFRQVKEHRANGKHYKVVYNRLVEKTGSKESRDLENQILSELSSA